MTFVTATAEMIGLNIADRHVGAVEEDFARAAQIAAFLMEFPLQQDVEAAPVFQP